MMLMVYDSKHINYMDMANKLSDAHLMQESCDMSHPHYQKWYFDIHNCKITKKLQLNPLMKNWFLTSAADFMSAIMNVVEVDMKNKNQHLQS